MIKVRYYANLREITGMKEESILDDEMTVHELIDGLISRYHENFSQLMFNNGELRSNVIILVNGLNVIYYNGTDQKIKSGDSVDIFPPVAGG